MEGCAKFAGFFYACLGRQKMQQSIEVTSRNTYGRKLKEALDNKREPNGPRGSEADTSKPLPRNPPGRASLDLSNSPRSSANLTDLVDSEHAPISEYDLDWYQMLTSVHNALSHTRYTISGRMGMSIWGCANGSRSGLSIVCPVEAQEAIKIWAITTSGRFSITSSEPNILTFQSPSSHQSPSRTWRIRIRWVPEAVFIAMPKVEMALRYDDGNPYAGEQVSTVNVLTLPALLDNCAHAWAEYSRKQASDHRLRGLEEDILSILERIMDLNFAEEGAGPLTDTECRHVVSDAFWSAFTKKHPNSPAMFCHSGLPLPQPPTTAQPGPSAGMVYPDQLFSNPRPAPAVPPKDKGRDLTANVKRKPEPEPARRSSFMDLFKPTVRKEAKAAQAERERRRSEDARKLAVAVSRGSRRMDESKQSRLKKVSSRRRDRDDDDVNRHHRDRKARSSNSSSSRGFRPTSTSSAPPDGTKVSDFDPSALERSISGNGRIPRRGFFADLYIVDDGEFL